MINCGYRNIIVSDQEIVRSSSTMQKNRGQFNSRWKYNRVEKLWVERRHYYRGQKRERKKREKGE